MGKMCYICRRKASKSDQVSLFMIPKEPIARQKWMKVCDLLPSDDLRCIYICSVHFSAEHIDRGNQFQTRCTLKIGAFPSIGVPNPICSAIENTDTSNDGAENTEVLHVNTSNDNVVDNVIDNILCDQELQSSIHPSDEVNNFHCVTSEMEKKTSTARVRAFRERKNANKPPKKPPKTTLERNRAYRARQKALKEQGGQHNLQMTPNMVNASIEDTPPLEPLASVLIKEELDVDDDYSANTSETCRHDDDMDFEGTYNNVVQTDPLEVCKYTSRHGNFDEVNLKEVIPGCNSPAKGDYVSGNGKTDSVSDVSNGLSTILRIADSLALDINNILTDDLGLNDINPTQSRSKILQSREKDATLAELKSKCTELEQKLKIHYLEIMLKKEEELVDIEIEANRVYLQNVKMEAEQKMEAYLQKMENLKLEHKLMKLRLEKETK